MCISHSVMEGQRHNNPLNPRLLLFTTAQKGWSWLLTHAIVEVAKALGGSFKLVMLTPKTAREMTQMPSETQKDGDIQTNHRNTMNTQNTNLGKIHKTTRPNWAV